MVAYNEVPARIGVFQHLGTMMGGTALTSSLLGFLFVGFAATAQAESRFAFSLVPAQADRHGVIPVSATPFDPTSLPQERFFGRESYSSRAVALDIVLNAVQVRHSDSLIYRHQVNQGYRVSTRWRLRASRRNVTLRYEIRF